MALIAGHMGRGRGPADWQDVVSAAGLGLVRWNEPFRPGSDVEAATALAAAGLAALVALPFLILLSLALATPFAAPVAIALGYLGVAHATAVGNARRATAWSLAVLLGLVGWAVFFSLTADEPRSTSSFAALLLAPLSAGAPALARALLMARHGAAHRTSHERAPPMRMDRTVHAAAPESSPRVAFFAPAAEAAATAALRCDVQEAISFALRRVGPKAKAGAVTIVCGGESKIVAGCDRAFCRRVAYALLDSVISHCEPGGVVSVEARNLRGAVLVRVSLTGARAALEGPALRESLALTALATTIDEAGGTMIFDTIAGGTTVSIRLASAADWMAERGNGKHAQAA